MTFSNTRSSHSLNRPIITNLVTIHFDPAERTFPTRSFVYPLQNGCTEISEPGRLLLGNRVYADRSTITSVGEFPVLTADDADDACLP
ncbi:hypothetical protein P879_08652, partial [Paragonimus westermani]